MKFYSTNRKSPEVSFKEALLIGQAPDKGLYMPKEIPKIKLDEIKVMKGKPYAEVAFEVMNLFLKDEVPEEVLKAICEDAYDFDVPLQKVRDNVYIMWLDEGPTLAFKDFGARMMARLMSYFIKQEGRELLILTATSGDTGGAVGHAFHGVEGIRVVILFPDKEVTGRQRRQMTTLGDNVTAVAVDGKFDDCQALVKQAFSDPELKHFNLSSANSINFGRLLPQAVYYFYAYANLGKDDIVFSVPCGNFGNLMAGLIAREMGLPVKKFVASTNENDEFPRFVETGIYRPVKPSRACISNAMNVGHPSNLERLFDLFGGWLDVSGEVLDEPNLGAIHKVFFAVSVTDEETRKAIACMYEKYGIILDPHGAVGFAGLEKYLKTGDETLAVSVETADPAKFPEEIVKATGVKPSVPESMKALDGKKESYEKLANDYKAFKGFLKGMRMRFLQGEELEEAEAYLSLAAAYARNSTCEKSKRGVVIVKQGEVIGRGYNRPTIDGLCDPCIRADIHDNSRVELCSAVHAEQAAIIDAARRGNSLTGARMYHATLKEGCEVPSGEPSCTVCSRMVDDADMEFVMRHEDGYALYGPKEFNRLSFKSLRLNRAGLPGAR